MDFFESFSILLSGNGFILFAGILVIGLVTYFSYKYTIPHQTKGKKLFLISLRAIALTLLLFLIFEPVFVSKSHTEKKPVNLLFIDNSSSVLAKDSIATGEAIRSFKEAWRGKVKNTLETNLFGNGIVPLNEGNDTLLTFRDPATRFSDISKMISDSEENIASVTIVSDGIVTDGAKSVTQFEKRGIPIFTIAVGDTTKEKDVRISDAQYNKYIYSERETVLEATLLNKGYGNEERTVSLFENGKLISSQSLTLSPNGLNKVRFDYKPTGEGEKKITIAVSRGKDEKNVINNRKIFFIDVLKNKTKVLLLAGAPSKDYSILKQTLSNDTNIDFEEIVEINENIIYPKGNFAERIDSAEIIFILGWPKANSNSDLKKRIAKATKEKPYFLAIDKSIDYSELEKSVANLPFEYKSSGGDFVKVQPVIEPGTNAITNFGNSAEFESFPPIFTLDRGFKAKPGSSLLAKGSINGIPTSAPLLLSRRIAGKKSVALLGFEFWRWVISNSSEETNTFKELLNNTTRWLIADDNSKQFLVKTDKRIYSAGENVTFTAELYNEAFTPIEGAEIEIGVKEKGTSANTFVLREEGNGIYKGEFAPLNSGDYSFTSKAIKEKKVLHKSGGKFNVGEIDIERANRVADNTYLEQLAHTTGGSFYYIQESGGIFDRINNYNNQEPIRKELLNEFRFRESEWIMAIVIFLFATEWFFRKKFGML